MRDNFTGTIKKCPICKKPFYILDLRAWVYKHRDAHSRMRYYCSWHCLQESRGGAPDPYKRYERGTG